VICLEHPAMVGGAHETKILKGDRESPDNKGLNAGKVADLSKQAAPRSKWRTKTSKLKAQRNGILGRSPIPCAFRTFEVVQKFGM